MMKVVEVHWIDAVFRDESVTAKTARAYRPQKTTSVGLLVEQNDRVVVICQSVDVSKELSEVLTIPSAIVTDVREYD